MPKRENATLLIVGLSGLLAFPSVGAGESPSASVIRQTRRVTLRRRTSSARPVVVPTPTPSPTVPATKESPEERGTVTPPASQPTVSLPSAPAPPQSSEEPSRPARAVELRFWYTRQPVQVRLDRQRRVPAAAPQQRKVKPQAGDLVLQGEDRNGKVAWQRPVDDPTILFDDTPSRTGTTETPPRGLVLLEAAPLWVYVPVDPALARVRLFAPIEVDEAGAQKPWKSLGAWAIEP